MKIIIENIEFTFDIGCKLLKLKHENLPSHLVGTYIEEIWNDIVPATFAEICNYTNVEQRRVGMFCLGIERLVSQASPELVSSETLTKTTTWINKSGEIETITFEDTYKLFNVRKEVLNGNNLKNTPRYGRVVEDCYYVQFKDTSTDREYMLWVDFDSILSVNDLMYGRNKRSVNAIDAIAWSIQTTVPLKKINKIVRQGDCILINPKGKYEPCRIRHLTGEEYRTLITAES